MNASETRMASDICAIVRTESFERFLIIRLTAHDSITHDNTLRASMAKTRVLSRADMLGSAAHPINKKQKKMIRNGATSPAASNLRK